MLEMDGKRVYPLANENGIVQGTMEVTKSLIEDNVRVVIKVVGQINEKNEGAVAKQVENLVKTFCL